MHRPTIALIAVVLLAVGFFTHGQSDDDVISGACLRVGAMMGILWLAEPQLRNLSHGMVAAVGAGLLVVMRWPKLMVVALPFAALLWLLKRRPRRPDSPLGERRA